MSGIDSLGGSRPYQTYTRGNQRVAAQQVDRTSSAQPAAGGQQPKFSIGEWCLNFVKGGVVDTVKSICSPQGLLMLGVGAALYLNPVTGPFMLAATPFLIGAGVAMGGTKLATNGVSSLIKAAEGDVEGSYMDAQAAGQGAATVGLSLVGARSFYRGGGAVSVNGRQAYAFGPNNNMGTKDAVKNLFLDMRGKLPRVYNDGTAVVGANGQNMSLFQIARQNAGQAWVNKGQIFSRSAPANAGVAGEATGGVNNGFRVNTPNNGPGLINPRTDVAKVITRDGYPGDAIRLNSYGEVIGVTKNGQSINFPQPMPLPPQYANIANPSSGLAVYQPSSNSTALVPYNGPPAAGGQGWIDSAKGFFGGIPGRGRQVIDWARQNPNDAITRGAAYGGTLQPDQPLPLDGQMPGQFYVG